MCGPVDGATDKSPECRPKHASNSIHTGTQTFLPTSGFVVTDDLW
jgi:hypothetical protein